MSTRYSTFEDWFAEQEGFSVRAERFDGEVAWLKAAFEAGRAKSVAVVDVKPLEWVQTMHDHGDGFIEVYYVAKTPFGELRANSREEGDTAYRRHILSALLPKATAPVVSEPGAGSGDLEARIFNTLVHDYPAPYLKTDALAKKLARLYASPKPEAVITEEIEELRYLINEVEQGDKVRDNQIEAAESRVLSLEGEVKAAALHVEQLSELLKIIKEHWIDYDHVFSLSVHEADTWLSGHQALSEGEKP